MKRICIIYPVADSGEATLDEIKKYSEKLLSEDYQVEVTAVENCFTSIETEVQAVVNGAEVIKLAYQKAQEGVDGILVFCFDDPGVKAVRELMRIPVVGLHEPSILLSELVSEETVIITTDWYGITCMRRKAIQAGYAQRLKKIIPVDLHPPKLGKEDLIDRIIDICRDLEKEKTSTAVLGCGSMLSAADEIKMHLADAGIKVQLIEPLSASLIMLETMIRLGLHTEIISTKVSMNELRI